MRKFIVILAVILAIFSLFFFELPFNLLRPVFHKDIIDRYARRYSLDPLLVTAVVRTESNFLRGARSHRGAIGLMQLLPATAKEAGIEIGYNSLTLADIEKPAINIHVGTYYLAKLKKQFNNNEILMLAAYNAGKNKVELWNRQNPLLATEIEDIPYPETRRYVNDVLSTYQWLKRIRKFRNLLQ